MNKTYRSYKPTGIEWVADIPAHWKAVPVKFLLKPGRDGIRIGPFGSALKSSLLTPAGYKVYGQENVIKDDFQAGRRFIGEDMFKDLSEYQIIPGDILVTMMGTTGKSKVVPESIENGIMDSHLIRLRANPKRIIPELLSFLINESYYAFCYFKNASKGSIMEGLNSAIMKDFSVVLPPLDEQDALYSFLTGNCALIDAAIQKKQRLIELLEEERTARINEAVTKGINPDAPMKPSGLDWLGDMPAHWEVKKLKFGVTKVGSGITPKGGAQVYQRYGIPLLRSQNIYFDGLRLQDVAYISEEIHQSMIGTVVRAGDVLLNITGASIGRCYFVDETLGEANVNQHVCIIRPSDSLDTRFLYYLLRSHIGQTQIDLLQNGANREGLNFEQLRNFRFPIPELEEQRRVSEYLLQQEVMIKITTQKISTEIELLGEYRAALINEVVTGKCCVLDSAPVADDEYIGAQLHTLTA